MIRSENWVRELHVALRCPSLGCIFTLGQLQLGRAHSQRPDFAFVLRVAGCVGTALLAARVNPPAVVLVLQRPALVGLDAPLKGASTAGAAPNNDPVPAFA